jgi:phosphate transport system substrate-binding protein
MSQKNDTITLLLTLVITSIIVGGVWVVFGPFLNQLFNQSRLLETNTTEKSPETFADVKNVPEGLFDYGGSTTWAPIRKEVDEAIQTVYPKFSLRYTDPIGGNPGSGTGIKMLLNNQLAFSQSSRSLKTKEYEEAEKKDFKLKEIPVAIDGIAIAINPNLKVSGITVSQLKDIYTGKIKNWSEVGGSNMPIIPYSRTKQAGGTVEFFVENVMEGEEFGNNIEYVYSTTLALRKVADNLGSIYYASAPEVIPQCTVKTLPIGRNAANFISPYQLPLKPLSQCPKERNQLNIEAFKTGEYPLTRRLFVIVKQNGQKDEIAGLKYVELLLTNQGQKLISQAGFVPIN